MNHTIIVGTDLNDRKITCSIPNTTEITELKYIAKVTDDKYIAENKMTVEGQTGECSVGYYHYNDTINIFYLRNSSEIVTNLSNFKLPDDFGTVAEIDDTAVLYNYLTRDCHEKLYVICEDFCKEESMNKSQILTAIEDEAAEQAKSYGVPNGSIFNFDGDTIPGGFEEVENPLVFENTDAMVTNVVSRNLLPNKFVSKTVNGVTGTLNKDNSITLNGTSTASSNDLSFSISIKLKAGTYTLSSNNLLPTGLYISLDNKNETMLIGGINKKSFTITKETLYDNCIIYFSNNITFDNLILFLQLEEGITATNFTPHLNLQETDNNVVTLMKKIAFERTVWGNTLQNTGINVNAGSGGKTYLICYSTHSSTGDATTSYIGMLRCGYSNNKYSITQIVQAGTGILTVNFSIDTSGNLQYQNSAAGGASKVSIYALT